MGSTQKKSGYKKDQIVTYHTIHTKETSRTEFGKLASTQATEKASVDFDVVCPTDVLQKYLIWQCSITTRCMDP